MDLATQERIQELAAGPERERLVVVVGTAAPGELRKYYREQVQDLVYGAMVK